MADYQFTISGFADEIDSELDQQLAVLESLEIQHLDVRNVAGTNVLDFSDEQVDHIRGTLDDRNIGVTSIGSPIGKIGIEEPFDPHFERFETALERAKQFDTEYVRIFSYYIPDDAHPSDYRDDVLARMRQKVDKAETEGIILLHENEKGIYGDTPERCRDLLTTIDSPNLRAVFDPANFLEIGVHPYPDALLQLIEFVEQLHIKDATFGVRGEMTPAGEGDGEIASILRAFMQRDFVGTLSLEPHLAEAGAKSGYTGPEGYEVATSALRKCLDEIDAEYQ